MGEKSFAKWDTGGKTKTSVQGGGRSPRKRVCKGGGGTSGVGLG